MSRRRSSQSALVIGVAALVGAVVLVTSSSARRLSAQQPWPVEKRALLRELAILRRQQRPSDLDGAVLNGMFARSVRYDRALVRRATPTSGAPVFLVPVERGRQTPASPGLMIFGIGGAGCCVTAAEIHARGAWTTSGPPNRLLFVVPDGVARLSVTLRTGHGRHRAPTVSGAARDNVIVLQIPFAAETLSGDPVTWYGPSGRVIKRFVD